MSRSTFNKRAAECLSLFEKIVNETKPNYSRSSNEIACRIPWHDEYNRFRNWCAIVGTDYDPEDRRSLDHRVRDADHIEDVFRSLFMELKRRLMEAEVELGPGPTVFARDPKEVENGGKSRQDLGDYVTVLERLFGRINLIVGTFHSASALLRNPEEHAKEILWGTWPPDVTPKLLLGRYKYGGGAA